MPYSVINDDTRSQPPSSSDTASTTNPLSLYVLYSFSRTGTDVRHGGHQVAQNSSSTTLPRWSDSLTSFPDRSLSVKSGAVAGAASFSLLVQPDNRARMTRAEANRFLNIGL